MKTRYYISSGLKNAMYTLRVEETSTMEDGSLQVSDFYIRNLSRNLEDAKAKAKRFAGRSVPVFAGDLNEVGRDTRNPRIIYFGKYRGHDISVMPDDYAVFVYGSMSHAQFPAFWETVAAEFADALGAAKKAAKAEARREARARKRDAAEREAKLARAIWIDAPGRITVTATVTDCFGFQTSYGYGAITKMVDDAGIHYLYWNHLGDAGVGDRVTFDCRVKDHDTDRDDTDLRINIITRATKITNHGSQQ